MDDWVVTTGTDESERPYWLAEVRDPTYEPPAPVIRFTAVAKEGSQLTYEVELMDDAFEPVLVQITPEVARALGRWLREQAGS